MGESSFVRLELRAPLVYSEALDTPVLERHEGELLLCYELDPVQGRSIEPDRDNLLGALLFSGAGGSDRAAKTVTLPAGTYLFSQRREYLCREEWLEMAIEQQKDGLWERLKPENRLYVRFLFEDGKPVTQLFRPVH